MKQIKLEDLSNIKCEYYSVAIPSIDYMNALVIKCIGECGAGAANNGDAYYLSAMIAAGFKAWNPKGLILDLRELKYEWGDMMCLIFEPPREFISIGDSDVNFPFAVVTSSLNEKALTSLIKYEMFAEPSDFLFSSLESAMSHMDKMAVKLFKKTRPN